MFDFIINNIATIIVCAVIAVLLFFALRYLYRNAKNGNHCAGCSGGACSKCHSQEQIKIINK